MTSTPASSQGSAVRLGHLFNRDRATYEVLGGPQSQKTVIDEDLSIEIRPYKQSASRRFVYRLLCFMSFGLFFLLCRWIPRLFLKMTAIPVPLEHADIVAVVNQWKQFDIIKVDKYPFFGWLQDVFPLDDLERTIALRELRVFVYRYHKFVFNPRSKEFETLAEWLDRDWAHLDHVLKGVDDTSKRQVLFGLNEISIKEKSSFKLLVDEILNPFYIFQVASIILWCIDDYFLYASCIFAISTTSAIATLLETKATLKKLRKMSRFSCNVRVWRGGKWWMVKSEDVVPGDIIELNTLHSHVVPCDAILLDGDCIVNESMLTGESVPISKFPIKEEQLASLEYTQQFPMQSSSVCRYFLFSGTKMIRVRAGKKFAKTFKSDQPARDGVLEEELGAIGMVVRTGFNTEKGSLVRSMLFPKPNNFQFYRDSFRFIGVLSGIAVVGFIVSTYNFIQMGASLATIIVRALDLITIVVPPALPATMSIGTGFALSRLRKSKIFCISPPRVNICGKLNLLCFDKTGTLTQEGLDVLGFRYITDQGKFSEMYKSMEQFNQDNVFNHKQIPDVLVGMACCHSIKSVADELIGDPLDLKMFEFTKWHLEEPLHVESPFTPGITPPGTVVSPPVTAMDEPESDLIYSTDYKENNKNVHREVGVIRTFDFASDLRRMSVIVRIAERNAKMHIGDPDVEKEYHVYCKGAPEVMQTICDPSSKYSALLKEYTHHGYRVIALAQKSIRLSPNHVTVISRKDAESGLFFVGFIVFENKLKKGTVKALSALDTADIRMVMCSGDNVLTAISVGRECGILKQNERVFVPRIERGRDVPLVAWEDVDDHSIKLDSATLKVSIAFLTKPVNPAITGPFELAVTGEVFQALVDEFPIELLHKVLIKGQIFARMSPEQKHLLVERFQDIGYCVGFVGDGANDCGALKSSDVGLSLSEAEASVAAPFTSQETELVCVIDLIREGRAALVTSFSSFKYMALYSLIQFTTVSLMYASGGNLGDFQYMYIDLMLIIPIATVMSHSRAYHKLDPKRPTGTLISKKVLISLFGQIFIQMVFQFFAFYWVQWQPWYTPPVLDEDEKVYRCFENTVVFLLSCFQYIIVAVIFSVGPPYREKLWKNESFVALVPALALVTLWVTLDPPTFLFNWLELVWIPKSAKVFIIAMASLQFLISYGFEHFLVEQLARLVRAVILQREDVQVDLETGNIQSRKAARWRRKGKIYKALAVEIQSNDR